MRARSLQAHAAFRKGLSYAYMRCKGGESLSQVLLEEAKQHQNTKKDPTRTVTKNLAHQPEDMDQHNLANDRWYNNGYVQNVVSSLIIVPVISLAFWLILIAFGFINPAGENDESPLRPEQIVSQIENAPPYQQASVAKSFVNSPINWKLDLYGIEHLSEGNQLRVSLENDGDAGLSTFVFVNVPLEGNEWLSMLKRDSPVRVRGQIESGDDLGIRVKNGRLEIAKDSLSRTIQRFSERHWALTVLASSIVVGTLASLVISTLASWIFKRVRPLKI